MIMIFLGFTETNGLELQEIPEPSSTVLIGLSGLTLILRRRK